MKLSLKISILLNVGLLGGLIFIWADRPKAASQSAAAVSSVSQLPARDVPAPAAQVEPRMEPVAFRWQQLDAADYHVYVQNLRAIGCPEVTADVHAAYQPRINTLEKNLADLATSSWSTLAGAAGTGAALRSELQNLPVEESSEIADVLGWKSTPVQTAAGTPANSPSEQDAQEQTPATMPLVFQNLDPAELGLDDEQSQIITNLRQNFVEQVGGTNQDPNDPAYLARWQQAQPAADSMLRGRLGNQIYSQYLLRQVLAQDQQLPVQ